MDRAGVKRSLAIVACVVTFVAVSCDSGAGSDDATATTDNTAGLNADVGPTIEAVAETRPCVVLTWDEAQAATAFPLVAPQFIPDSFEFTGYALIAEPPAVASGEPDCQSGINRVEMQFRIEDSDTVSATLIQGTPPPPNYVDSVDEEGEMIAGERVVRGIEQTTGAAEIVRFDWISGDRYFTLYGPVGPNLSEEALVEMLASMPE